MKCFFVLVLFLCLTSCLGGSRSSYDEIVDKISAQYVKKVCQTNDFTLMMIGGGVGGKISLGFKTIACVSISGARLILLQKEEDFLALINGTPEIQPYLNGPSSAQTVSIKIAFYGSDKTFVIPPYIAYAYISDNTVFYAVSEVENDRIMTIFSEPYEEAYKIVYGKEREPLACF